ncbi:hypothetical protein chiPu_0029907, partial [Chiloscyllium punctatum]|nr:hypothetical protein [Chiloscyllium punctatum]
MPPLSRFFPPNGCGGRGCWDERRGVGGGRKVSETGTPAQVFFIPKKNYTGQNRPRDGDSHILAGNALPSEVLLTEAGLCKYRAARPGEAFRDNAAGRNRPVPRGREPGEAGRRKSGGGVPEHVRLSILELALPVTAAGAPPPR